MEGGAGAGLAGSEGWRKEELSLGVTSAAVCLGGKSGYGGSTRARIAFQCVWVPSPPYPAQSG